MDSFTLINAFCKMTIKEYLANINTHFKRGIASEHTFRADLQILLESLVPTIKATNEPRRQKCGAPDYVLTHNDVPVGYIEAKDVDKNLKDKLYREQFDRYRNALDNLIITDYLIFEFYKEGEFVTSIQIGEIRNGEIIPLADNFDTFTQLIQDFCRYQGQTIRSAKRLAELMAAKARLLSSSLHEAIEQDIKENKSTELWGQLDAFRRVLIDTLTPKEFADIYAQTIAYGMFAARLHDTTLDTFSRFEAATLIPHSNPFLRKMFQYIAGYDLDERIAWVVDALADLFKHTNVATILKSFGKATRQHDPIIHFYETFLAEYDPKLRKSRGVWYTPEPVVNFIVRAVNDILIQDFDIADGLASRETIQVERSIEQSRDKRTKDNTKKELRTYHRVQILDPATGTGTFLAEVVKQIHTRFENNKGMWNGYVSQHLIPRLNGFELLMASYAMAHLKMDLLFSESEYKAQDDQRFNIFLTNSLEESHPEIGTLFASWLSDEANAANRVKRDTPVMCVIGNPPYSVESQNKGEWIMKLMEDYKKEPNTNQRLKERNPKVINDDYVKFIRYAQYYVEKNGSGVVAFINPHGFLDNVTFRGMRWNLLKTFDKIYTLDLHGNAKKKEVCPDGSKDENVFDIMQGVSINLFVKTGKKHSAELGKVYHADLWGKREHKYEYLIDNSLSTIPFVEIQNRPPMYYMVQKDFGLDSKYQKGFSVNELFSINTSGIKTHNDKELVSFDTFDTDFNKPYFYRPFDIRNINYDLTKVQRHRYTSIRHILCEKNIAILLCRQQSIDGFYHVLVGKDLVDMCTVSSKTKEGSYFFPLYLYPDPDKPDAFSDGKRKSNLDEAIVAKISKKLKLAFVDEENEVVDLAKGYEGTFAPIHLLDYIYAVLHSPTYRDRYKEFLKTDFPRVPYPTDRDTFWQLVDLGKQIRELHLMEAKGTASVTYPCEGTNTVTRGMTQKDFELTDADKQTGRVWINDTQYFDHVPLLAWQFYIGGYQPAQKWLKDRRDRQLSFDDQEHYQNIIHALTETDRLMNEIDQIKID